MNAVRNKEVTNPHYMVLGCWKWSRRYKPIYPQPFTLLSTKLPPRAVCKGADELPLVYTKQPKSVWLHKIGWRDRKIPISLSNFVQSDRFWLFRVNEGLVAIFVIFHQIKFAKHMLPPCCRKWQLTYYGKKTLLHSLEFKAYMIWLSLNQNIMHHHASLTLNSVRKCDEINYSTLCQSCHRNVLRITQYFVNSFFGAGQEWNLSPGNTKTKGGSISVPLTSCLTGLEWAV